MAVAHVQTVKTLDHSGVGTIITSGSFTTGAGALLLVAAYVYEGGAGNPTVSTVQLDATTGFTQDLTRQASSTDSRLYIFSLANVGAGSHTVNMTRNSVNTLIVFFVTEVSGAATSSPQDGVGASATATSANPASGNFTASVSDGFWFAAFGNENTTTDNTIAAGSGWTMDATNGRQTDGSSGDPKAGVEYRANPGSAGAFNGDFVAASANYAAAQFVYKAAGAGGPPPAVVARPGAELLRPFPYVRGR